MLFQVQGSDILGSERNKGGDQIYPILNVKKIS